MSAVTGRYAYLQVAEDLREKIADDTYAVGEAIPSTKKLMETYKVSSTVARAAVNQLRSDGLVVGQPGKAVYVARKPGPPEPSEEYTEIMRQIETLQNEVQESSRQIERRLTRLEQVMPPAQPSARES